MNRMAHKLGSTICSVSLATAHTASALCLIFLLGEPKMPVSLYRKD